MAVKNLEPSQLHDTVGGRVTFVNADGTTYKNLLTVTGSDNSQETHVYSIVVTSTDTASRDLRFAINDGTNDMEQGDIAIASNSGFTTGTPPIQVVANRSTPALSRVLKDIRGNWFVVLRPGETLKVRPTVAVTATYTIAVSCFGYKFTRTA